MGRASFRRGGGQVTGRTTIEPERRRAVMQGTSCEARGGCEARAFSLYLVGRLRLWLCDEHAAAARSRGSRMLRRWW